MGPQPAPLLPNWEPFVWKDGYVQIVTATVPCNWFQCQENAIDPVHFEWMHSNWSRRLQGKLGRTPSATCGSTSESSSTASPTTGYVEGMSEDHERWTIGRIALWPNCLGPNQHFEWRVPIDDENTLFVVWHFIPVPLERRPYVQARIPTWEAPVVDPLTGRFITSHIDNQDFVAWAGQGRIADRTKEHLGPSDRGIIMMRKRFFDDLKRVERGEDPSGLVRDPGQERVHHAADRRPLLPGRQPAAGRDARRSRRSTRGASYSIAGQPRWVHEERMAALGLDPDGTPDDASVVAVMNSVASTRAKGAAWWTSST